MYLATDTDDEGKRTLIGLGRFGVPDGHWEE